MTDEMPAFYIDPEAAKEMMRQASAAFNEAAQQLVALIRPGLIAAGEVIQRFFAELDEQWPEWREFAANVGEHTPESQAQACHCFCAVAHGGLGVCAGEAEPGLIVIGQLGGERIDIPVCRACHEARALIPA